MKKNVALQDEMVKFISPLSNPMRYTLNEYGSGKLFADTFSDTLCYVNDIKCWFHYDGVAWQKSDSAAMQCANELLDYLISLSEPNLSGFIEMLSKHTGKITMIKEARYIYPVEFKDFDTNPYLLNCLNYTIDFVEHEIKQLEHSPKHFITKRANVNFDQEAKCDRWLDFVDEVMCSDLELVKYLQKALGYSLFGSTSKECFFILYGSSTRNGKGTCMETILNLMGDLGKSLDPNSLSKKGGYSNGATPEFARLDRMRFVNVSEPTKGQKLNAAFIKRLTGGDSVTARFVYQNTFEYRPQFKIFINTNHLLDIDDDTIFSSDRLKMIPFDRHFDETERDETLKETFRQPENMSGILNWLLEGYKLFLSEGLTPPEKAVEALKKYRRECDTIALFIEEALVKSAKSKVKTSELYENYIKWREGFDGDLISQKEFVNKLREKDLVSRDGADGNVVRGYKFKD